MIYHADCLEVMPTLPAESVDSIVTDPPYGLSFMGKNWDHGIPGEPFWREALRIAKPGTHLLAFGGTRTFHRLTCAIEDAGWEIRDCIMWVYGSGFPKSLDVSKAIDRMDASEEQERRRLKFTAWVRSQGVTSRQIDEATGTNMGGHYTMAASQPAIMTREHLEACRHLFSHVPEWVERETDIRSVESRNLAARVVVGQKEMIDTRKARAGFSGSTHSPDYDGSRRLVPLTEPATPAAQQWQGWGTALKPAWEPIIVARKPLAGTVAQNVQQYGTGVVNVDGCKIGSNAGWTRPGKNPNNVTGKWGSIPQAANGGRWPANLIHDGSDEVVGLFPETGPAKAAARGGTNPNPMDWGNSRSDGHIVKGHDDNGGSAARFFYCAKASKADRDEGNRHPTVKPTALMRYLCRLVTPPDGIVFDPFCGSGSTGKAATLEGFRFIGIEREAEYVEIAKARIAHARGNMPLLANA